VLFQRDARGRLVATRDPEPRSAPWLFLGRAADCTVWATSGDLDAARVGALAPLLADEPRLVEPRADRPPRCRERALAVLSSPARETRGPCYLLPVTLPGGDRAREIRREERGAWPDVFPWLEAEFDHVAPVAIAFVDGEPAAVCHAPRGMTAEAAEAGVETRAPFRGRGLATAAVACWARLVQQRGRHALYSTSWDNVASRGVARRLGARCYGESWQVSPAAGL